jgi:hypothetical protein
MYQCFKSFLGKLFFINERPNANAVDPAAKVLLNTSSENGNSFSQSPDSEQSKLFAQKVLRVTTYTNTRTL